MITSPVEPGTEPVRTREPQARSPREQRGTEPPGPAHDDGPGPRAGRSWPWVALFILAACGWYFRAFWLPWVGIGPGEGPPPPKGGGRPVPVRTAVAGERDIDLYLNGLGTVTAFKTVTLKSRVDGELVTVAFTEGQMVHEGDLLAEIDPRPFEAQLQQAEGQLARDRATLELAKLTLERGRELLKTKSIAPQQVDEQAAQVDQMEATLQTDQALVANARLQLSYCRIVAPLSGRIGLRLVDQGNIVRANDPGGLAVITQLQPISLVFTIPQDDIPRVLKATHGGRNLTVDAYDRDFRTKLATGTLAAVDNQVDAATGTLRLKAVFENRDNMLFPNQFVNARLLVETRRGAIVVPSAAVQRGPNSTFVYVVLPDKKVDLRNVTVGPTEGAETIIASGLTPGEVVVTDGIDKLQNGSTVTVPEDAEPRRGENAAAAAERPAGDKGAP